jgi:hypothetical protein
MTDSILDSTVLLIYKPSLSFEVIIRIEGVLERSAEEALVL